MRRRISDLTGFKPLSRQYAASAPAASPTLLDRVQSRTAVGDVSHTDVLACWQQNQANRNERTAGNLKRPAADVDVRCRVVFIEFTRRNHGRPQLTLWRKDPSANAVALLSATGRQA
jgi:hypothetical protein